MSWIEIVGAGEHLPVVNVPLVARQGDGGRINIARIVWPLCSRNAARSRALCKRHKARSRPMTSCALKTESVTLMWSGRVPLGPGPVILAYRTPIRGESVVFVAFSWSSSSSAGRGSLGTRSHHHSRVRVNHRKCARDASRSLGL